MTGKRVLITCRQMQACISDFRQLFEDEGIELVMPDVVQQLSEEELIEMIGDFDGMIAGDDPLSAEVLKHGRRLQIISKWGVGIDGIDLDAAKSLGIVVVNTPNVFGGEVADVAMGYVVMLARQLHRIDASVKAGQWLKHEGLSLEGMRLGVAGFGSVGQALGRRAAGFGMKVLVYDISDGAIRAAADMEVPVVTRNELFEGSDFLVLCSPLNPATFHMANEETIGLMSPGGFLVNVGRGALIDEKALVSALSSGHIAAAALDVFEEEPLPLESALRKFDACVFGSHNASNTRQGVLRASRRAVDNLLQGLNS